MMTSFKMHYYADEYLHAPQKDHIEITVFGPSYGESIVLHIPSIGWGVIDSCRFKTKTKSVNLPLDYLTGVLEPNYPQLAFIILTHPHEDHYKGLDEIINKYPGGVKRVCWYAGDGIRELKQYICRQRVAQNNVLPGFAQVLNAMENSVKKGALARRLGELTPIAETSQAKLFALSPSALNIRMYVEKLFKSIPEIGWRVKPMDDNEHNLLSTSLFLKCGKFQAILGSDLENIDHPSGGWNAIMNNNDCPEMWAHFVKIAHHGSTNGYNQNAWETHCKYGQPIAVLTPFMKGNRNLPESDLIEALKNKVSQIYATAFPKHQTKIHKYYSKDIERSLRTRTRNFKIIEYPDKAGFVRFRFNSEGHLVDHTATPPASVF